MSYGRCYAPAPFDPVAEDLDDLLAVHARAPGGRAPRSGADALRIIVGLEPLMRERWPVRKSLALVDATLVGAKEAPADLRCEVLLLRARLLDLLGYTEARASAAAALFLARAEGNVRLEGSALALLGSLAVTRGDLRAGSGQLREALVLLPELDPALAADTYCTLAMALRTMGDLDAAKRAHDSAASLRARIRGDGGAAADLACLATLRYQCGDAKGARDLLEDARARAKARGDRYTHARVIGTLARVLSEEGLHDDAAARYEEAIGELDALGERRLRALLLGYFAASRQLAGARLRAAAAYREAIFALGEQGDRLHEGLFAGAAATLAWACGEATEAESLYDLARGRLTALATSVNPRLSLVLSLYLGHRDLWMRRIALGAGYERAARAHLEAARKRLTDSEGYVGDHDDLRLAYRLLQAEVGRVSSPAFASEIEIGPDAVWFRVGGEPRVDLRRRRAPRLILHALVEQRLRSPGSPVPMDRLIASGWPGEKMLLHAGMNRLYVAIRSLRELGLRWALLRQDDGYLLDPTSRIVLADRRGDSDRPSLAS